MERFYEEYKLLIETDKTRHSVILTSTEYCTQHMSSEVRFDYQKVYNREDTYHDVAGFYHTHPPGVTEMSSIDIETMKQWVRCLGKSLVCLIETNDSLKAWIFSKDGNNVIVSTTLVGTTNDVNYAVSLEGVKIWERADFGISEGVPDDDRENDISEIMIAIEEIQRVQNDMVNGFNTLVDTIQSLIGTMTKEE